MNTSSETATKIYEKITKNRNCLSNRKVVMRYKVSGAIAIPKASWGCAPALPNRTQVVSLGQAAGK